jgi:hypothetical protein
VPDAWVATKLGGRSWLDIESMADALHHPDQRTQARAGPCVKATARPFPQGTRIGLANQSSP